MKREEKLGKYLGYFLGIITALVSFLRSSRMFHPRGVLFEAQVISKRFPAHAMIRLSSSWWKEYEWPDALGIGLRFSDQSFQSVIPKSSDQDLLMVSFSDIWKTPFSPLITNYRDFFANDYFSVGNFEDHGQMVRFRLATKQRLSIKGSRLVKLNEAVLAGEACFILYENETPVAEIKLLRSLHYDQEALRFDPFLNGLGIKPRGFLQHLRVGTYRLSQWARPEKTRSP